MRLTKHETVGIICLAVLSIAWLIFCHYNTSPPSGLSGPVLVQVSSTTIQAPSLYACIDHIDATADFGSNACKGIAEDDTRLEGTFKALTLRIAYCYEIEVITGNKCTYGTKQQRQRSYDQLMKGQI